MKGRGKKGRGKKGNVIEGKARGKRREREGKREVKEKRIGREGRQKERMKG